jgi:hypothetical protein
MSWFWVYRMPSKSSSKTADEHGFPQSVPQSHKKDITGKCLFNLFVRFAWDRDWQTEGMFVPHREILFRKKSDFIRRLFLAGCCFIDQQLRADSICVKDAQPWVFDNHKPKMKDVFFYTERNMKRYSVKNFTAAPGKSDFKEKTQLFGKTTVLSRFSV